MTGEQGGINDLECLTAPIIRPQLARKASFVFVLHANRRPIHGELASDKSGIAYGAPPQVNLYERCIHELS